ncbi:MAG: translation elongation factor Ts [Candidatus Marinimicrobia bacterium]|nr:translation elongation factor Ts [Candidatus Neomarinimicrobiota bacterium]MCF7904592.1 translation elongation factor Ts [Candidatus Neomarinimicrobiota bacterium]
MAITAATVKELREKTGVGMMECKSALQEADGDINKAVEILRKKGVAKAAKKVGRATNEGLVFSYIHAGGKLGALVEIACETDFVAKTEQFQELGHNIAMHVAAASPDVVNREQVNTETLEKESEIFKVQALNEGKPEHIVEKIVSGRLEKYYKEVVLMEQSFVKDPEKTITDLLNETIASLGENMSIVRFQRFAIGESDSDSE